MRPVTSVYLLLRQLNINKHNGDLLLKSISSSTSGRRRDVKNRSRLQIFYCRINNNYDLHNGMCKKMRKKMREMYLTKLYARRIISYM